MPAPSAPRFASLAVCMCLVLAAMAFRTGIVSAHDAHDMGAHMAMTPLQPAQPGDKARADAIVAGARAFADRYTDYRKALADGYTIFMPQIKQDVYHFTNNATALDSTMYFDPAKPTSLLYEQVPAAKTGEKPGYKLVGVMYTAPFRDTPEDLDKKVPLSVAQWHLHTNLCLPPPGVPLEQLDQKGAKFGLQGTITTAQACTAANGRFIPHLFGWMVHVYPYEKDPAKVWAAGMEDDHGMDKDTMPMGMKM